MDYLVTAIITTHHREAKIIERALRSVLQQTYKNIEVIIVNDAPNFSGNSNIEKMLKQYSSYPIRYVMNTRKAGACASRNMGIDLANGQFVALLDDDDEWLPSKISDMILIMTDDVGLVYSSYDNIKSGKVYPRSKTTTYDGNVHEKLLYGNFIGGCSIPLIRKSIICEAGGFDENMPSAQDIDAWLRISKLCKVKYLDKALVHYYVSDVAITSNINGRITGWERLIKKYETDFNENLDALCIWNYNIIETEIAFGQFKKAIKKYNEVRKYMPYKQKCRLLIYGITKYLLVLTGLRKR